MIGASSTTIPIEPTMLERRRAVEVEPTWANTMVPAR